MHGFAIILSVLFLLFTVHTIAASHEDGQIFDKDSNRIGSYRQTGKDRITIYDANKNRVGTIRVQPSGKMEVFDKNENRTKTVVPPSKHPTR